MIELYTGTPGSGKSLHLAEKMKSWMGKMEIACYSKFYV